MKSTSACCDNIARLKQELDTADAVVIGAGSGLSTSAGFTYTGERFQKYFGDFIAKYGFRDMYSGGFYPFDSLEEHWAYWSSRVRTQRLAISLWQVSENSPPNRTYTSRCIRLSSCQSNFPACNLS